MGLSTEEVGDQVIYTWRNGFALRAPIIVGLSALSVGWLLWRLLGVGHSGLRSGEWSGAVVIAAVLFAVLAPGAVYLLLLFIRSAVIISDEGLRLQDWKGKHTFVAWPSIVRVVRSTHADEAEAIDEGWLRVAVEDVEGSVRELDLIGGIWGRAIAVKATEAILRHCELPTHFDRPRARRGWGPEREEVWER